MDQPLQVGSPVVIIRTDNVQHRVPHLIGTKGIVREVPQHPNTWYKVKCSDGATYTLRPTALQRIPEGDEGSDDEVEGERFSALVAASSESLAKVGKGRGRGRGGKGRGRRNHSLPASRLNSNIKSSGGLDESRDVRETTDDTGVNVTSRHQIGKDNVKIEDDVKAEGDGVASSTGMEFSEKGSRSYHASKRNEEFRDQSNKSNNDAYNRNNNSDSSETGTTRDGSEKTGGSSSSSNNGERGVKGDEQRIALLAKKKPLTSLDPEDWINEVVAIVGGRLLHSIGKVLRSGNGWVQLLTSSGEVAKRAYELAVVNSDELDEEWEKEMSIVEEMEKQLNTGSPSPNSQSGGGAAARTRNSSRSPMQNLNEWRSRYSQADGGDEDGTFSGASPDDDMDTTDGFNSWGSALASLSSRLPPRVSRRQRLHGGDGKGFGSSLGNKRHMRIQMDSYNISREPRGLQYSRLSKDRGFGKVGGGSAKYDEHVGGEGDDRIHSSKEYSSRGPGKGMVGGKGERKNRKDPNASAFDGAEGGRNAISPQKAERDRAKEAKEKAIEKQNAADVMRHHIEQQLSRSKQRPNLSYFLKQLEEAGTDLSTDAEDVDASFEVMPLRCSMCLVEKMEGDLFCWNRKCMASPIFEEYFHKGDVDNDAGDVDMEESSDCIRKESVEEEEDDDGRLISSGTKNDKVSSTLSSTVMPKEPHNSFQHRTIIDPSVSYALCAPVKWIEMQKRTKNGGYESFSADPVLYRWQCWASSQGVGNSALGGMVCYPYPMDRDYSSSENPTIHHQEGPLSPAISNNLQK